MNKTYPARVKDSRDSFWREHGRAFVRINAVLAIELLYYLQEVELRGLGRGCVVKLFSWPIAEYSLTCTCK
jgi:hypothetical protein